MCSSSALILKINENRKIYQLATKSFTASFCINIFNSIQIQEHRMRTGTVTITRKNGQVKPVQFISWQVVVDCTNFRVIDIEGSIFWASIFDRGNNCYITGYKYTCG